MSIVRTLISTTVIRCIIGRTYLNPGSFTPVNLPRVNVTLFSYCLIILKPVRISKTTKIKSIFNQTIFLPPYGKENLNFINFTKLVLGEFFN